MKLRLILPGVLLFFACRTSGLASDVALFGIVKSSEYVQTNAGAPVGRPANGFAFNAFVIANSNHVVTGATVKPSNSTPLRTLLATDTNGVGWRFEERTNTQAQLDNTYPNGNLITPVNYAMTMNTVHDGTRVVNLNFMLLPVAGQPAVPQITNFAAAQDIDHTANFTLGFVSSGNALVDLVQLIVLDASSNVVFATPAPFTPGALTGASNTVVIPGYTLPANAQVTGHLTFARPVALPETNAYPGAVGVPAVLRDTEFPLVTRPSPAPPHLTVLSQDSSPFQFRYTGESNRVYHVQASEDFVNWTDVLVTNRASAVYTDPRSDLFSWRFYRVQVGP